MDPSRQEGRWMHPPSNQVDVKKGKAQGFARAGQWQPAGQPLKSPVIGAAACARRRGRGWAWKWKEGGRGVVSAGRQVRARNAPRLSGSVWLCRAFPEVPLSRSGIRCRPILLIEDIPRDTASPKGRIHP